MMCNNYGWTLLDKAPDPKDIRPYPTAIADPQPTPPTGVNMVVLGSCGDAGKPDSGLYFQLNTPKGVKAQTDDMGPINGDPTVGYASFKAPVKDDASANAASSCYFQLTFKTDDLALKNFECKLNLTDGTDDFVYEFKKKSTGGGLMEALEMDEAPKASKATT